MTIAALRALLDQELPHIRRPPAPRLNLPRWTAKEPEMTTTEPPPTPTPQAETAGGFLAELQLGDLLAWARAHEDTAVQALGEQTLTGVAELHDRRERDAELATVDKELAALEARAAELRARQAELQPPAKAHGKSKAQRDYDPATVRTWAREHGHEAPDRGRIPTATLTAWRNRNGIEG